jgi:hypothetical protein
MVVDRVRWSSISVVVDLVRWLSISVVVDLLVVELVRSSWYDGRRSRRS